MNYYLYPLRFLTPVHFGDTSEGGTLESITCTLGSDIVFSACCHELLHDKLQLEGFVNAVANKQILFSSLLPYHISDGEYQFYVPSPIMHIHAQDIPITSFDETKRVATAQKKIKSIEYIRASNLLEYKTYINKDIADKGVPVFGETQSVAQVNMRGEKSLPYYVGGYQFLKNTGLYLIMGFHDESMQEFFESIIESLGVSGIGGKRSSGYGKFELADDPIELSLEGIYEDDRALYSLLTGSYQHVMCISSCVPTFDEIQLLKKGSYTLQKRGGFVVSPGVKTQVKRNSYYVIKEGSVCSSVLDGQMLTITGDTLPHPVYRNGTGLWIGVDYE